MKTYTVEGREFTLPHIGTVDGPVFRITEGPHAGAWFTISNMQMDETDESLMHYEIDVAGATVDQIKEIVDNFIISILLEQIERAKNETSPTSNSDT